MRTIVRTIIRSLWVTLPVTIVVSDAVAYVAKVDGQSMQPTFNEDTTECSDFVLLSHWASRKYDISRGQIVSIISPRDPNQLIIKRVIAVEGDTVVTRPRYKHRSLVVPKGHCWVEGDNAAKSMDSNTFGSVPLGLISAISLYIIWPPKRWTKLESYMPSDRTVISYPNQKCLVTINCEEYHDFSAIDDSFGLIEQN